MSETLDRHPSTARSTLPGATVLRHTRGVLLSALGAAFAYGFLLHASSGYCPGGITGDGTYLDADGRSTDIAPQCISLTLEPSFLVYVAIAIIVLAAITKVLNKAETEEAAIRTLDRAVIVVISVVTGSISISYIWFGLIPVTDWDGSGAFFFPFPFGAVDVDISPLTQG
jgi:hypothetical protein